VFIGFSYIDIVADCYVAKVL